MPELFDKKNKLMRICTAKTIEEETTCKNFIKHKIKGVNRCWHRRPTMMNWCDWLPEMAK